MTVYYLHLAYLWQPTAMSVLPPAPKSAAIQIVKPTDERRVARAPPHEDAAEHKKTDTTQRLCKNVLIYGSCRFQESGCAFYHPPPNQEIMDNEVPLHASPSTPTKTHTSLTGANLDAPVFVPKSAISGANSPRVTTPVVHHSSLAHGPQDTHWPSFPTSSGLLEQSTGTMSSHPEDMASYGTADTSMNMNMNLNMNLDSSAYLTQQLAHVQLDHHMYTPALPHLTQPPISSHPLHSFFMPDDIRHMIQARQEATYIGAGSQTGLPAEVGPYHSLFPLERHPVGVSRVYSHPSPVYRAISSADGSTYVLRRIEGFKLVKEAAFQAVDTWRKMRHPNIVGLREAFTTKAFNDHSLILVYDFHPNSTTLEEEHLNPENRMMSVSRNRHLPPPIPERLLWSYITQITNALKAIHSSGLAVRNLDPSKIILTGKNRIRLNGLGTLDVLSYDPSTTPAAWHMEDLVGLGKLILTLTCEFFSPGMVNIAGPLDYITRHYSADVKNLVIYCISKPHPGKGIDEIIKMLGPRILNEFDAMQNYNDVLESEFGSETENGRLVRVMTKMGFINERAEFELDSRWSDTGDRYIIKLFRDYVFHSVGVDNQPVLDLSHVITCLNKLDAGLDERIMLMSRDDQSCLVVTYREIRTCIDAAYNELRNAGVAKRR